LEKLLSLKDDREVQNRLLEIKAENKKDLKSYLAKTLGVQLDENSIYDIQIKRLHEYKRQQMNVLYVIY
ncbi:hypothetical protein HJU46_18265, partial [Clostridium butyricum]|nr:hypothetical protein [Clostridium butyricum]